MSLDDRLETSQFLEQAQEMIGDLRAQIQMALARAESAERRLAAMTLESQGAVGRALTVAESAAKATVADAERDSAALVADAEAVAAQISGKAERLRRLLVARVRQELDAFYASQQDEVSDVVAKGHAHLLDTLATLASRFGDTPGDGAAARHAGAPVEGEDRRAPVPPGPPEAAADTTSSEPARRGAPRRDRHPFPREAVPPPRSADRGRWFDPDSFLPPPRRRPSAPRSTAGDEADPPPPS